MRRIIAALLTLCVTAATVSDPAGVYEVKAAEAQETDVEGMDILEAESSDFRYVELEAGKLKIIKYKGNDKAIAIPFEINGKKVVKIGVRAFSGCNQLESITIPESVNEIEDYDNDTDNAHMPFSDCENLTEIVVEEGNAWYSSQDGILYNENKRSLIYCPKGKKGSITIPESVTEIGHYDEGGYESSMPLNDCQYLTEIIVEEGNARYSSREGVLYDKSMETLLCCPVGKQGSVTIPESVTAISIYRLPYKHTLFPIYRSRASECSALGNCPYISEILVDSGNTRYSSLDGVLYDKGKTQLLCCPAGKQGNLIIPDGVISMGGGMKIAFLPFNNCQGLTSITIPESVTNVSAVSFFGCSNLTEVVVAEENISFSSSDGILYEERSQNASVESRSSLLYCPAGKQGSIIIPDNVTAIQRGAFYGCSDLERIVIPKNITDIAYNEDEHAEYTVFQGCSRLTEIIVEEGNGNYCSSDGMLYYTGLESGNSGTILVCCPAVKQGAVAVQEGVKFIQAQAFNGCDKITEIVMPKSITSIGEDDSSISNVFRDCINLAEISVNEGNRLFSVREGMLYQGSILQFCPAGKQGNIMIPQDITDIAEDAFSGCKGMTEITVEKNNRVYISLDGILYKKGEDAAPISLIHCPAGKEGRITVADGVQTIGAFAFKNCLGVKEIVMPDSIRSIGEGAFSGCEDNVCIRCVSGSYAERYAKEMGMDYALIEKKRQTITAYDHVKTVGDAAFPLGADTDGNARLSYESGDASVASVSINGIVTIHGQGTAYITITAAETTEYEAAQKIIMITVNPAPGTGENPTPPEDMIGTSHLISGTTYTITSVDPKEARVTSVRNLNEEETLTSIAIASIVTINGIDYQVTSIADKAFQGMEMLERAAIGSYVRTIGKDAFKGCKNLTEISVSGENETYSAYEGCVYSRDYSRLIICPAGKASVRLKDGLSGIGEKDFAGCQKLAAIEIPESVTDIAEGAFADCGEDLCIICAKGSAAEAYAIAHSLRYETAQEGKKPQIIVASDYVKTVGDAAFSIEAIASGGGELSYESGNEAVAVVSAKGTAAVIGAGTAAITITAAETDEHEAAQKVITITVNPKPGTGNNNQQNSGNKKEQTITAADIAKTYGDRQFPIEAVADSGGALSYAVKNPAVAAIDGNGIATLKSCGRTEVVITAAAHGEYKAAEKTITLTVSPKKLKGISAKSTKAGTLTVKWKKDTSASGYIIECSTDRKFRKNVKAATVKKNKTTSKKITKLKSGKKYYVRACAYAQAGGTKIRGAYASGKKAVKVKK